MLMSLATSMICSNTVFLAGTPYINYGFIAQVRNSPRTVANSVSGYIASLRGGRDEVASFQQERLEQYVADQSEQGNTNRAGVENTTLPPPQNPEDFAARGYTQVAQDVYTKQHISANTVEIFIGENSRFEKRTLEVDGEQIETWIPL